MVAESVKAEAVSLRTTAAPVVLSRCLSLSRSGSFVDDFDPAAAEAEADCFATSIARTDAKMLDRPESVTGGLGGVTVLAGALPPVVAGEDIIMLLNIC